MQVPQPMRRAKAFFSRLPDFGLTNVLVYCGVLLPMWIMQSSHYAQRNVGLNVSIAPLDTDTYSLDRSNRPLIIGVDAACHFSLNSQAMSRHDLERILHEVFRTRAERVAFVVGDRDVQYSCVVQAVDIARGASADKVVLLTPQD